MRPAIKTMYQNKVAKAVGDRMFPNRDPEETDHEFIIYVLGSYLGDDWYKEEKEKDESQRHTIVNWFHDWKDYRKKLNKQGLNNAWPTGNTWSIMTLAYDIYCLAHTMNLWQEHINRLKKYSQFQGALYEIKVGAIFARLGYKLKPITNNNKPCEFIAERNDCKIMVEAKTRERDGVLHKNQLPKDLTNLKTGIHRKLNEALKKDTESYPFIIFIDINMPVPREDIIVPTQYKQWWKDLIKATGHEESYSENNLSKYNALFITNFSYHYQGNNVINTGKYNAEIGTTITKYVQNPLDFEVIKEINDEVGKYGAVPRYI